MKLASSTSVVIPTDLRPDALQNCVHSLLEGGLRPEEIVVRSRKIDEGANRALRELYPVSGQNGFSQ